MENQNYVQDDYPIQKPNFIIHKVNYFFRSIFGPSPDHSTKLVRSQTGLSIFGPIRSSDDAGPSIVLIRSEVAINDPKSHNLPKTNFHALHF